MYKTEENQSNNTRGLVKPINLRTLLLSGAAALSVQSMVSAEQSTEPTMSIPSQEIGQALHALTAQTGIQFLYDPQNLNGQVSNAVEGRYTNEQAVRHMLAGTKLAPTFVNNNTVTIAVANTTAQPDTPPPAPAPRPTPQPPENRGSSFVIEEIVVSAQKRTERLQDVPISITAIGSDAMERTRSSQLVDIQRLSPNLLFGNGGNKDATISIRGISDYTRNVGYDARTGVYLDGVYVGQSHAMNQELLDIERVEILRGPQGTLFGKNTVSGAINLITKKPQDELRGLAQISVGNFDKIDVQGMLNVPLVPETLFIKVSGRHSKNDGYITNIFNGEDLNGLNIYSGRAQLRYLASDNLEINFSMDALHQKNDLTNAVAITPGFNPRQVNHNSQGYEDRELFGASMTIDYTIGDYILTSISSYRWSKAMNFQEEDYTPLDIMDSDFFDKDSQISQELRIASPTGERFDYVAGVYYFYQKRDTNHGARGGVDFALPNFRATTPGSIKGNSYAAFINGNLHLTDALSITAGGRYTHETKDLTYSIIGGAPLFIMLNDYQDKYSDSAFTPRAGITYKINPDILTYFTYSRGFKSGGWNADFLSTTEQLSFGPEFADNYEIGFKSTSFDGRLRFNASAFIAKYSDYQVSQFVPTSVGTIITLTNAGAVTTKGFELEMTALPFENFEINANFGYVDATFDSFKDGGGPGIHYDGNRLPYAPKISLNIAVDYTYPLTDSGSLLIHADYSYVAKQYSNPNNLPDYLSPSYSLVNMRVGYEHEAGWGLYAWVHNLTDKLYSRFRDYSFLGVHRSDYGPPRTYGVEAKYRF